MCLPTFPPSADQNAKHHLLLFPWPRLMAAVLNPFPSTEAEKNQHPTWRSYRWSQMGMGNSTRLGIFVEIWMANVRNLPWFLKQIEKKRIISKVRCAKGCENFYDEVFGYFRPIRDQWHVNWYQTATKKQTHTNWETDFLWEAFASFQWRSSSSIFWGNKSLLGEVLTSGTSDRFISQAFGPGLTTLVHQIQSTGNGVALNQSIELP